MTEPAAPPAQPDPRDQAGRVARNIASVAASQVVTWAFSIVAIVIVPRALGPTAVGQLGFSTSLWALASIVMGFGSGALITREISQDTERGSRVVSNVIPMQWIAFVAVSSLIFAYAIISDADPTIRSLLAILGVMALITKSADVFRSTIIGRERLGLTSAVSVIARALVAGLTVTVVLLDRGVESVALVSMAGGLFTLVVLGIACARDPEITIRPNLREYRDVLSNAIPLMLLGSVLVLYREIDVLTLNALADDEDVGFYAATDKLFGAMVMVPSAVAAALYPTLSRRWPTDPEGVYATLRRVSGLLGVLTLPMAVGAVMLGPEIATTVLGSQFEKSGDVMRIYGIVQIPVSWTVVFGTLCTVAKRERVWTIVLLLAALATVPLDLILVPFAESQWDNAALAGAIAFLITETAAVTYGFTKLLPGVLTPEIRRMLGRSAVAAGVMAGVVWVLRDFHVAVPIVAGGVVYGAAALALGAVRLEELANLGGPFRRLARFRRSSSDLNSEEGMPSSPSPPES